LGRRGAAQELLRQRGELAELEKMDETDKKALMSQQNKKKMANMEEILLLLDKPPGERTSKVSYPPWR
jgi:hypothetical protein